MYTNNKFFEVSSATRNLEMRETTKLYGGDEGKRAGSKSLFCSGLLIRRVADALTEADRPPSSYSSVDKISCWTFEDAHTIARMGRILDYRIPKDKI